MTEPEDFDLDIALSADLDGDLAGYAAELGTDEATLRARIAAAPGASERRARLQEARDHLAGSVDALDEVTRARLVANALGTATGATTTQAGRPPGWYLRAAAAAAIALVVVGGGIALVTHDRGNDGAAKSAATDGGTVRSGDLGDLGNIDQQKLDELVGGPPAAADAGPSTSVAPRSSSSALQSGSGTGSEVNGFDSSAAARARPDQVAECTKQVGAGRTVRFNGSGAYQGEPAVIVGVATGERTVVFVVAAGDCSRVLYSVSR